MNPDEISDEVEGTVHGVRHLPAERAGHTYVIERKGGPRSEADQ